MLYNRIRRIHSILAHDLLTFVAGRADRDKEKAKKSNKRNKKRRAETTRDKSKRKRSHKQAIQARALAAAEARRRGIGRTAQKVTAQRKCSEDRRKMLHSLTKETQTAKQICQL